MGKLFIIVLLLNVVVCLIGAGLLMFAVNILAPLFGCALQLTYLQSLGVCVVIAFIKHLFN
jgi:hypothetical protein